MKKIQVVCGMALMLLLAVTQNSFAGLVWDWSFDQSNMTVGPNDTAVLNAMIFNDPTSTTNITYSVLHCAIENGGTANNLYNFSFGPNGDFYSQFQGIDLAPGNSAAFVFGTETPINPPIAVGTSVGATAALSLGTCTNNCVEHPFQITVGPNTAHTPEPSVWIFFALMAGFIFWKGSKNGTLERLV